MSWLFSGNDEYNEFIDEIEKEARRDLPDGNAATKLRDYQTDSQRVQTARDNGESWLGTTNPEELEGDVTSYLYSNELDGYLQSVKRDTVHVDVIDIDQQKAIKFTEQEIGVFSFDLASLGLIRVYEYYSPTLKKVVNGNYVKSQRDSDGNLIFYHVHLPAIPKHKIKHDEGTIIYFSPLLDMDVSPDMVISEENSKGIKEFFYKGRDEVQKHNVERRQKRNKNGSLKFSTTWKKSFIEIPKVEQTLPRIDIIINTSIAGANNANLFVYNSMGAIALAEKLSQARVPYRIVVCYALDTSGSGATGKCFPFVTLKKEGEPLDKNRIAIGMADPRQYRWQVFRGMLTTQYDAGWDSRINTYGLGYINNNTDEILDAYMETLAQSDNPEDIKLSKNRQNKIVFDTALNQEAAVQQYRDAMEQISGIKPQNEAND